jgi:hypothetical protein
VPVGYDVTRTRVNPISVRHCMPGKLSVTYNLFIRFINLCGNKELLMPVSFYWLFKGERRRIVCVILRRQVRHFIIELFCYPSGKYGIADTNIMFPGKKKNNMRLRI